MRPGVHSYGFITEPLIARVRQALEMKMNKERNDLEFHRETRKEQTLREVHKKAVQEVKRLAEKKESLTKDRMSELEKKIVRPASYGAYTR